MKKIMFSDRFGLTQAVLDGRKTMTRRIVPDGVPLGNWSETLKKSRYQPGEVVAVAQAYKDTWGNPDFLFGDRPGWTNKMFVKAELMPHHIRITNVRIERLKDISEEDCMKEGITTKTEGKYEPGNGYGWDTSVDALKRDSFFTPRSAFAALIDKVSGKGTWNLNPWVFVYEFELVK